MNENYLEHHGILGQKWGQRRGTSYPLDKSQYSSLQRKLNGVKSSDVRGSKIAAKAAAKALLKKQKEEKAAVKKETAEKRKAENLQKEKSKLVKSRNIKKILKNADKFTDDEIKAITNRLQLEKNLKNVDDTFVTKGKRIIERMEVTSGILNKTASIAENGTKTYNNVAKILNSMTNSDLPIIGEKKDAGPKGTVSNEQTYKNGKLVSQTTTTSDGRGNTNKVTNSYEEEKTKSNVTAKHKLTNGYRTSSTYTTTNDDGSTSTDTVKYSKNEQVKTKGGYSWTRGNSAPRVANSSSSNSNKHQVSGTSNSVGANQYNVSSSSAGPKPVGSSFNNFNRKKVRRYTVG